MAEGMNKVYLIGNLGADAELNTYAGNPKLTFNLATTERWKDKHTGDKKERTDWHRCSMWGTRAEKLATHLTKGKALFVEGAIRHDSYEKDGQKKYSTEIRVLDVRFLGSKERSDERGVDFSDVVSGRVEPPPLPRFTSA